MGPKGQETVEAYVVLAIACRQVFGMNMYGVCVCTQWSFSFLSAVLFLGGVRSAMRFVSSAGAAVAVAACVGAGVISRSQKS